MAVPLPAALPFWPSVASLHTVWSQVIQSRRLFTENASFRVAAFCDTLHSVELRESPKGLVLLRNVRHVQCDTDRSAICGSILVRHIFATPSHQWEPLLSAVNRGWIRGVLCSPKLGRQLPLFPSVFYCSVSRAAKTGNDNLFLLLRQESRNL